MGLTPKDFRRRLWRLRPFMLSHKSEKARAPRPKPHERPVTLSPSSAGVAPPLAEEVGATLRLAWPMVLTNLAQVGMTTTDLMFIGRLGPQALAAGVLGLNLYFPFFVFAIGFLSAIAPIAASERGRKAHSVRAVRASVRQGFWATAVFALAALLVLFHGERLLTALGQDAALAAEAGRYLRWLMWSLPAQMAYVTLRSFFAALERPMAALIAIAVGFLVNAVANYALVFGRLGAPQMGIEGSGLATTIASFAMLAALVGLSFADRRARRYRVFGRFWRADRAAMATLARLGAPMGLTMLFESAAFNAAVFLMGRIGEAALAAHAIAIQVATITFMTSVGFSQAASVRVGRFFGAGDGPALRRAGWTAFALGLVTMGLCALVMALAPRPIIAVFLDVEAPANAEVVTLAARFLFVAAIFQLFDAAQSVGAGMLRGLHDARWPMVIALIGYWGICLPLGAWLALARGWGGVGVWYGFVVALALVAAAMVGRWMVLTAPRAKPSRTP